MTVEIYDTTLRDGAQGVGINFSVSDKLRIADHLDRIGVSVIEGGWPGANQTDTEFFAAMRGVTFAHARLAAFGATRRPGVRPQDDLQVRGLVESGAPVVTVVGKSWDAQVHDVLRTSLEENISMITDTVSWLVEAGREVCFDAEHFFDGHRSDADYAFRCLEAASTAGAHRLALCDTNGGTLPEAIEAVTRRVTGQFGDVVGIHCHDDTGCAVANTLAAVRAGAVQVQGCINGYGERTGNANLCTLIPALQLKMGHRVVEESQLSHLSSVARDVAEIANLHPPVSAPYVGAAAFTHKGGQHVDAMRKASYAYQHIEPGAVGNRMRTVVSSQSGGANIVDRADELGIDLGQDHALVRRVTARVKELEHRGYAFEDADGSFELLIERARGQRAAFQVIDYLAFVEHREGQGLVCEATVKIRVGDAVVHTAADGNGPVNAIDAAMRKALSPTFPETASTTLHDYKVRVLDGHGGTAAAVRVLIESGDHERRWSTVGCSTNIIEASCVALADAFEYCILQERRSPTRDAATA